MRAKAAQLHDWQAVGRNNNLWHPADGRTCDPQTAAIAVSWAVFVSPFSGKHYSPVRATEPRAVRTMCTWVAPKETDPSVGASGIEIANQLVGQSVHFRCVSFLILHDLSSLGSRSIGSSIGIFLHFQL